MESYKYLYFVAELEALCIKHKVALSPHRYFEMGISDLSENDTAPLASTPPYDMTKTGN